MHTSTHIQLKTPTSILPTAKAVMERHGCLVDVGTVTLPPGSKRTEELNIRTISTWYRLRLPDRYEMVEVYDHWNGISCVYLPPE